MTDRHLQSLEMLLPPGRTKHCALLDPDGRNIPDPIGAPLEDYRRTAELLRLAIERRLEEWA